MIFNKNPKFVCLLLSDRPPDSVGSVPVKGTCSIRGEGRRGPAFRLTRYKKCFVVTGRQVEKAVCLLPLAELARHAVTK